MLVNVPVVKPLSVGKSNCKYVHETHITQGKIAQNDSSQLICIGYSNHEIHYKNLPILPKEKKKKLQHFLVHFFIEHFTLPQKVAS